MASKYTSNYGLCQWAETDKVLRTEFNADNAKIDAALKSLSTTVNGKASTTSLNSLKAEVKSDLDSLEATVSGLSQTSAQHTSELAGKGNCQIYVTTYTGTNHFGQEYANSITCPARPEVVIVGHNGSILPLWRGQTKAWTISINGGDGVNTVVWSGNTVKWYGTNTSGQMNENETYNVVAFMKAG